MNTQSPREHRIRALAYQIFQVTGRDDARANWFQAAAIVDAYPSCDFTVQAMSGKSAIVNIVRMPRENRHGHIPIPI
jgi:hypothetical protein